MEQQRRRAVLIPSDSGQADAMRDFLRWAAPGVRLLHIPGQRDEPDVLALLASRSALLSAFGMLPGFVRSRRVPLAVEITVSGRSVTLTAANCDDVMPELSRLL